MGLPPPNQFDKMSRTAMTIITVPASIRRFAIVSVSSIRGGRKGSEQIGPLAQNRLAIALL